MVVVVVVVVVVAFGVGEGGAGVGGARVDRGRRFFRAKPFLTNAIIDLLYSYAVADGLTLLRMFSSSVSTSFLPCRIIDEYSPYDQSACAYSYL